MRIAVASTLFLTMFAAAASGATYAIRTDDERNLVKFESKAPMESFEGTTHTVSGTMTIDPSNPTVGFHLEVDVDLASLDTGISLRNRHMRENHLETDEFPLATFRSEKIVEGGGDALVPGTTRTVLTEGTLDLHGVPRTVRIPLELAWNGGEFTIESRFAVTLADHEISRPGFLMMKLSETQTVVVHLVASASGGDATVESGTAGTESGS